MVRSLRTVVAFFFLIVSGMTLISWGLSYSAQTSAWGKLPLVQHCSFRSWQGQFVWHVVSQKPFGDRAWGWSTTPTDLVNHINKNFGNIVWPPKPSPFGFTLIGKDYVNRGGWSGAVPHWFIAVVAGVVAVFVKPGPKLQFGIRDLFILITVLAVLLVLFIPWMRLDTSGPRKAQILEFINRQP